MFFKSCYFNVFTAISDIFVFIISFVNNLHQLKITAASSYNRKLFFYLPQKQAGTQSTYYTAVFGNIFTFRHIRLNIYIRETNLFSYNQYLFGLLFFLTLSQAHLFAIRESEKILFLENCSGDEVAFLYKCKEDSYRPKYTINFHFYMFSISIL